MNSFFLWVFKKLLNRLDKAEKQAILAEAVKDLYKVVSVDDILKQTDGVWTLAGKQLTGIEVAQLQEEAAFIKRMKLFRVIKQDIRYQIGKKIWEEGKVGEDLLWGQLITWLWDVINTRISKM